MRKILLFSILLLQFCTSTAQAADMYLILNKNQVTEGSSFTGTVYVSTGGLPINNADSTLHFPADLVSIDAVTTSGSIFNIWVEQPSFSNAAGTMYFNGGLPTPGYAGQSGQVVRANFKAKRVGTANLSFGSPAIRANDGNGTNVLAQARGATLTIVSNTPTPATEEEIAPTPQPTRTLEGAPRAPVITSTDMPDQNAWYNLTKGVFSWGLPSDVTVVQLVLSSSPNTTPTIAYDPPIKNKTLENLTDGVLYLNGRFRNTVGWSKVSSRKIKIDTSEPENIIVKTAPTENDLVKIIVTAQDELSGVRSFAAYMHDVKVAESLATKSTAEFVLPPLSLEKNIFSIRAYDNAGNYGQTETSIEGLAQRAPKITHYPEFIKVGSKIEIRGKSPYIDSEVRLWIKTANEDASSYTVTPDEDKIFSFTSDTIKTAGEVSVWAQTIRAPGVESTPSEKIYVSVKESDVVWLGIRAIEIISLFILFLILFIIFIFLALWATRKVRELKRKIRNDLMHTEQDIHKVFAMLNEDTKRRMKLLEKAGSERKLTKEETKMLTEFSGDLRDAEKYLTKEIQDIEDRDL